MFAALRCRKAQLPIAILALCFLAAGCPEAKAQELPVLVGSKAPFSSLRGATGWINSRPLTAKALKGKVVLVDFWAYSCINCLRSMPYIEAWARKYKDSGLVVIGVHTPEFRFGRNIANVRRAVEKFNITFPVALDSNYAIWNAFHNEFWPADYFIGADGRVRYEHFGEGDYAESERWIQKLLAQRFQTRPPAGIVNVDGRGAEAAADASQIRSPETYLGYARAAHFASKGGLKRDQGHRYAVPPHLRLNEWAFAGDWIDYARVAVSQSAGGKIVFRFHARDLNLVLGPSTDGKPVRFRVTIDGHAPGENHGVDTDAEGNGVVKGYRMYQLIRQRGAIKDRTFTIEFETPEVQAFSFTFG